MKRLYIILVSLTALLTTSCKGWLEASSNAKIPAYQLFESREGFEDALSGIYMEMGGQYLYGQCMTFFVNDLAVFPYERSINVTNLSFQQRKYKTSNSKIYIENIWNYAYFDIANINMALRELEKHRHVIVNEDEYNLFKGELLGLRAYLHFDMMRLFGIGWEAENAEKLTIPYVTEYSAKITPQRSYADTEKLLMADLNTAIELLRASDPLVMDTERLNKFEAEVNLDGFWSNRTKHLNYYGLLALAARIHQWKDDSVTAALYAQQVIDGALQGAISWVDVNAQINAQVDDMRDWTFSTEHIFSLESTELYTAATTVMFDLTGQRHGLALGNNLVDNILYVRIDPVTGSQAGAEDVRGPALQLRFGALGYYCFKLYGSTTYHVNYRNRMPMMKISEMYYILAENYIAQNNDVEALKMLDEVRRHRGISDDFPVTADAETELTKEYHREFICEGQLFYYMKHKKCTSVLDSSFAMTYNDLVLPYPDSEINYGRKQDL